MYITLEQILSLWADTGRVVKNRCYILPSMIKPVKMLKLEHIGYLVTLLFLSLLIPLKSFY